MSKLILIRFVVRISKVGNRQKARNTQLIKKILDGKKPRAGQKNSLYQNWYKRKVAACITYLQHPNYITTIPLLPPQFPTNFAPYTLHYKLFIPGQTEFGS